MARERKPEVGRPFNAPVTTTQMNAGFQTLANVNAISVDKTMTIANTPGGGIRLGAVQQRVPPSLPFAPPRYAYIVDTVANKLMKVEVQFIKSRIDTSLEDEREIWSDDGDSQIVSVPANFFAADFEPLIRDRFINTTPIVRVEQIGGKWRIALQERWAIKERPPTAQLVRCG